MIKLGRSRLHVAIAAAAVVIATNAVVPSADAATATRGNLKYLSWDGSDWWLNYDLKNNKDGPRENNVDWGVHLVFIRNASVRTVKNAIDNQYDASGGPKYLALQDHPRALTYDQDSGVKESYHVNCGGKTKHARIYAPPSDSYGQYGKDRFWARNVGYYVLGTTHIDYNEHCHWPHNMGAYFADSEVTEADIANRMRNCGYRILTSVDLRNREARRVEDDHHWYSDGKARVISVDRARC